LIRSHRCCTRRNEIDVGDERQAPHRPRRDIPAGGPDAIRFAGNLLTGHKNGWGVEESDIALLVCVRHGATPFGYTDAIWSKYRKTIDPKATPPPTANS
jgi:hypothetical protein